VITQLKARYRYAVILLKQLVKTDFKLRYQNSFLGYLCSLLKPLFLFVIMYVVFVKVLHVDYGVDNDGAFLFVGLVLWSFFTELTGGSVGSVVGKGDLLRKLNFPRYVLVMATALSALINMLINFIIVGVFLIVGGADISWRLIFAPLILLELLLLGLGLAFFLSATFVKLRDIGHVWDVVTQMLFYATPIFFPVTLAPVWAQKLLLLNPLAQTLQDLRYVLVSPSVATISSVYGNSWVRLVPVLATVALTILTGLYFKKTSKYFAEEI
jgi:ABC-2 type transport system permease protein